MKSKDTKIKSSFRGAQTLYKNTLGLEELKHAYPTKDISFKMPNHGIANPQETWAEL